MAEAGPLRRSKRLSGKSPDPVEETPAAKGVLAQPKAECPFPFIFLHDPVRGLELHPGKLLVCIVLCIFYYYRLGNSPTVN